MPQRSIPAWFVRGGTSNGLIIRREDLPPLVPSSSSSSSSPTDATPWQAILSSAMGSPDPVHARQLDGMGSGISSTSKVVVLGPPSRDDVDVDYTFVQVGIKDGKLDVAGNCGNMSSAVGPVAWDMGIVKRREVKEAANGQKQAVVRFLNTNTGKVIQSRFNVSGDPPRYDPDGTYEMDGVPGAQSRIAVTFTDPAGSKTGKALPTGNPVDELALPDGSRVRASLVDVSNPGVFVAGASLGVDASLAPADVEASADLKTRLEQIRRAGAVKMGLDPDVQSVPKVVILFPAGSAASESASGSGVDIRCLALSMGQAHKAVPLTLGLCLGAATRMRGTLAAEMVQGVGAGDEGGVAKEEDGADEGLRTVTVGHPSGKVEVGTTMEGGKLVSAELIRTARVLMKGEVFYGE